MYISGQLLGILQRGKDNWMAVCRVAEELNIDENCRRFFMHGHRGHRHGSRARALFIHTTHDRHTTYDDVRQHGGHTPKILISFTLDILGLDNWQLTNQGIRCPVSHMSIAGSSVGLIKLTCFLEVGR